MGITVSEQTGGRFGGPGAVLAGPPSGLGARTDRRFSVNVGGA